MGQCLSSQINMFLIQHLKALIGNGQDFCRVPLYEEEFFLNGSPDSPKCNICLENFSIEAPQEYSFDESDVIGDQTIIVKAPEILIEIGYLTVRCNSLDYMCYSSGKIVIEGVTVVVIPSIDPFENEVKIENVKSNVEKIKSDIMFCINGDDHSRLANAFLSTNNPDLVNAILNAVLELKKDSIKDLLNTQLGNMFF